jgi:hypothetical protein
MRRAEWAFATGLTLLAAVVIPAQAGEFRGSGRLQSALVHDDNVFEAMDAGGRRADSSLRFLGDGRLAVGALPLGSRADLSLRVLSESFRDNPAEDRRQGEAGLAWDIASATARRRFALEAGYGLRAYPDSTSRGHHRAWGRVTGVVPVGPRGSLVGRFDVWQLDFRTASRVDRVDQAGGGFDLSYEHPVGRHLVLQGGLELSGVHHGVKSLRFVPRQKPPVLDPDLGPDRRDQGRFLHAGIRRTGRLVLQVQAGIRTQASNSIDGVFHRPEATWLISWPLGWSVIGQCYGSLKHTEYTALRGEQVTRIGEIEAGEDDNTIAVRLARPLGHGWDLDARAGWYRNEALFVGVYYGKRVISLGLSRNFGSSSGF